MAVIRVKMRPLELAELAGDGWLEFARADDFHIHQDSTLELLDEAGETIAFVHCARWDVVESVPAPLGGSP